MAGRPHAPCSSSFRKSNASIATLTKPGDKITPVTTRSPFRCSSRPFSPLQCTPYSTSGREPVSGAFAFSGIVKSNCADLQAAKCLHPVPSLGSQTPGRIRLVARQIASAFAGCGKSSSGDVQAKRARTNRAAPSPKAGIHDGRQGSACALKAVSTANRRSPRMSGAIMLLAGEGYRSSPPGKVRKPGREKTGRSLWLCDDSLAPIPPQTWLAKRI